MFQRLRLLFITLTCLVSSSTAVYGSETPASEIETDSVSRPGGVRKVVTNVIEYFHQTNKRKLTKRPNFAPLGGPYYSSEKGLGLGLVIAGDYSTCPEDSILPASNVSLTGTLSTKKYFSAGIQGTHVFPHDTRRIHYRLDFVSFATYFWGIGYAWDNRESNKTKYNLFDITLMTDYEWRLANDIFVGPAIELSYTNAHGVENYEPWQGQEMRYCTIGAGVLLQSDTRDNLTNPGQGHLLEVTQLFAPRCFGNGDRGYSSTEICWNRYQYIWKGCILALRAHGEWTYGHTPWSKLPFLGGTAMRGYYKGRYRDKCSTDVTVEFRQHVWRRSGIALWGCAGMVYHKLSDIRFSRILPEVGVGYRWEFKKNSNIRIDIGFGKHCSGFTFGLNEAF